MKEHSYKISYQIRFQIGGFQDSFELTTTKTREDEGFTEMVKERITADMVSKKLPPVEYVYQIEEL